ncbi:MAG: ABC transporter ATP-binding protein [Nitrospirae bacterium]|nr:MAG: ABC transporter ATP-binding protein [Nitrospirota bacterium]
MSGEGAPSPYAVEAQGVAKRFGRVTALRRVDLKVPVGGVTALFGHNGAGKTTFLRIAAGLMRPTAGTLKVAGLDARREAAAIRGRLGVVSHDLFLYGDLTARENLEFYGRLYGVADLAERCEEVLVQVDLIHRANSRVRHFSRGMAQRLAIARAFLHRPEILLLDEPYTGLDQRAVAGLNELIEGFREAHHTVLLTTHDHHLGFTMATDIAILRRGEVIHHTPASALSREEFDALYEESLQ